MLIVFLINRKDYELFLADVVFASDGLENFATEENQRLKIKEQSYISKLKNDEDKRAFAIWDLGIRADYN